MASSTAKTIKGRADFRLTHYQQIERWWEVVSSAYLLVSLQFNGLNTGSNQGDDSHQSQLLEQFNQHSYWCENKGWKHRLNNLQLIIQPYIYYCFIKPWLAVFEIPQLQQGFSRLIAIMNEFTGWLPIGEKSHYSYFSSA